MTPVAGAAASAGSAPVSVAGKHEDCVSIAGHWSGLPIEKKPKASRQNKLLCRGTFRKEKEKKKNKDSKGAEKLFSTSAQLESAWFFHSSSQNIHANM